MKFQKESLPKRKSGTSGYAYTNTRVRVMKTKLLKPSDFEKLLKMSLPEIARFLGETDYKREIEKFGVEYSGVNLLEYSLNNNLEHTLKRVHDFSIKEAFEQIRIYLQRYDVWNIKMILRGKFAKVSDEEILKGLIVAGDFKREFLEEIVKKASTIEEAIEFFKKTPYYSVLKTFDGSLSQLEDELDKKYFEEALKNARQELAEFLTMEIDTINTLTSLRAKKAEIEIDLIPGGSQKLLEVPPDMDDLQARIFLRKKLVEFGLKGLHKFKFNVAPVIGYFVAKENEINNLRIIVRCKHAMFDEKLIAEQLVI